MNAKDSNEMVHEAYINFNSLAKEYDYTRAISDESLQQVFRLFMEVNNSSKITNLLEIGCGTGRISKIFATNNFKVTGVDISEQMIQIALQKAKKEHWDFTGLVADARNLPFKDNEYDISYVVHVLELIKDWKKVIEEAVRCSKSKRFVIIDVERVLFKTDMMSQYWTFLHNSRRMSDEYKYNRLGAKNFKEIIEFMYQKGFTYDIKGFETTVQISKKDLFEIIKKKSFLVQQNIPDSLHEEAIEFLKEKNNLFSNNDSKIEIVEKGTILTFMKKKS